MPVTSNGKNKAALSESISVAMRGIRYEDLFLAYQDLLIQSVNTHILFTSHKLGAECLLCSRAAGT